MKSLISAVLMLLAFQGNAQIITTYVGGGPTLGDGGPATSASIGYFGGLICDKTGNLFIGDGDNYRVRKVNPHTGIIETYAGTGTSGFGGDGGPATAAQLEPTWVTVDSSNNLYLSDASSYKIRKVEASTGTITTIAGNGVYGSYGNGLPATDAAIAPQGIAVDSHGNLFIADVNEIRKVDIATGIISAYVGNGISAFLGDGGPGTAAKINDAWGICIDNHDNLYIADRGNSRVRKVNPTTTTITTVVGNGSSTYIADVIPATNAALDPFAVYVDNSGKLFIADKNNNRIRMVDASGIIHTVAGNGIPGFIGDSGPATAAEIHLPQGVATDPCNNLYIADYDNKRVRKVTFPGTIITPTIAITATPGDTLCAGSPVTFTSVATGSGPSPTYQWFINGIPIASGSSYTYTPSSGDIVHCVLTSNSPCASTPSATSNYIHLVVDALTMPSISLSGPASFPAGAAVTVNATVAGAGSSYTINWMNNGTTFATTSIPSVTYIKGGGIDTITAKVVSTSPGCYDTAISSMIVVAAATGISSLPSQGTFFSIHPNPATNSLVISANEPVTNITIYNMVGQVAYSGLFNEKTVQVNVSGLAAGIYIVKVNGIYVQKLVKE